jgi:hypothetical protein
MSNVATTGRSEMAIACIGHVSRGRAVSLGSADGVGFLVTGARAADQVPHLVPVDAVLGELIDE